MLPETLAKKLPLYPVPVFLLAHFAVHTEFHGHGLRKVTLIKALEYLSGVNAHIRVYTIITDCWNDSAKQLY